MSTRLPHATFGRRILRSLRRDANLPLSEKLRKGFRYGCSAVLAPHRLRACDRIGPCARTVGRPVVDNLGTITIGRGFIVTSSFVPTRLRTTLGAFLEVGDDVIANYGVTISAKTRITVGDRARFGQFVTIADHDGYDDEPRPVVIGNDVWLATRVTVKKGATIGDGTVVMAGSVVSGDLPPGVIAGGIPARVIRQRPGHVARRVEVKAPSVEPARSVAPLARGLLVADFSIQELAGQLGRIDALGSTIEAEVAPFDQVVQTLLAMGEGDRSRHDFVLAWTRAESLVPFRALLAGENVPYETIEAEVDRFAEYVRHAAKSAPLVLVPAWVMPPGHRGFGMRDLAAGGASHALMRMNLRLVAALTEVPNAIVLDTAKWIDSVERTGKLQKLWYLGKAPYSSDVLEQAALDVKAAVRGVRGAVKKLVVVDLDDTLWGGVVGDVGFEQLRLGGHDPVGEAFADFQRELKALARRGIALAVVSKNEEAVALEAIERHPEMVLGLSDIVAYRINWRDKAANVVEITRELNLGLDSVVFIDDNPVERARVREALPEVFVPDWPADPLLSVAMLRSLRCFDAPSLSEEDRARTEQYATERKRTEERELVGSLDAWLEGLDMHVVFAPLDATSLARATQLLNKTNQMNLRTRRLGEAELAAWAADPNHASWTVSVSDKFGNAGLTGLLSLSFDGERAFVEDFVLSCRVMGRRVEETMVWAALNLGRQRLVREVVATLVPTPKNVPCHTFWKTTPFAYDERDHTFRWLADGQYTVPRCVHVSGLESAGEEGRHVA
ncbi:Galactoside O-acetyltransferase [Labilithrix luteola]|uniref:Galactoside O-acetyltransferase n=1 Tax=Labilithrix luteola TaxID=1391654 RepID=A0A0K1Q2I4_9BACT|nr:HAD-IIIC family phosphatase [Labilithrix luteola]AKU99851.1 Galactoside O-acetyltransferase [Labilithrix luteola]